MRSIRVPLLLVALLVVPTGLVIAAEEPRFETQIPEPTLRRGTTQRVTIQLTNDAADLNDRVERAGSVEVTVGGTAGIEVESGSRSLGPMGDGDTRPFSVAVDVPWNISGGIYRLPITVEYVNDDERKTTTVYATVRIEERARFVVESVTSTAPVGGSGPVTVRIRNIGDEAAHDAAVTLQSPNTDLTFGRSATAKRYVGTWKPGETKTVMVDVAITEAAETARYALTTTVEFEDADGSQTKSQPLAFGVTPLPEQTFSVESVKSVAPVGGSGTVTIRITNTGERTVHSTVVTVQSANADLTFSRSATAERYVGAWRPGETKTIRIDASVAETAEPRAYAVDLRIRYEYNGTTGRSDPLSIGVTPLPEQTFAVRNVTSTLRVGEEGVLRGIVRNTGEIVVHNVVVQFLSSGPEVSPLETEVALGTLRPGASATFAFDLEIPQPAEGGPRQFDLRMSYRDPEGTRRVSDTVDVHVNVAPARDDFAVSGVDLRLQMGTSGVITVTVTNHRETTVWDLSAKLFADAPLSAADDEAFVQVLKPGASATLKFKVSVAGSALAKPYPLKIDFRYRTSDGDTRISDAYQIPVRVVQGEGSRFPIPIVGVAGAAVLLIVLVGGAYYLRE